MSHFSVYSIEPHQVTRTLLLSIYHPTICNAEKIFQNFSVNFSNVFKQQQQKSVKARDAL